MKISNNNFVIRIVTHVKFINIMNVSSLICNHDYLCLIIFIIGNIIYIMHYYKKVFYT